MTAEPPSSDPRREAGDRRFACDRILVGLGNPGLEYEDTKHNLGFAVLDRLAQDLGLDFERVGRRDGFAGRVKARVAGVRVGPGPAPQAGGREDGPVAVLLVKPQTFVNLSGVAVAAIARRAGLGPESIFVVYDDLNLPLGRIRIRPGGGPGGHNGMRSLRDCLGTEGFPRLRVGIGIPGVDPAGLVDPDFVLSRFDEEESRVLDPVLDAAREAALSWIRGVEVEELMSRYNGFGSRSGSQSGPPGEHPAEDS